MILYPWNLYAGTKPIGFTDEGNYFIADIPIVGAKKDCIEVKVIDNTLRVHFKGNEYTYEFTKEWGLPQGTTSKDITAKYESGILNIKVMKPKGYEDTIKVE